MTPLYSFDPKVSRLPRLSIRWAAELLWSLTAHRVSIRYKETLFGFGWIFLQPVALTVIFNYIQRVANIPTGEIPYPLFVATGIVAWSLTALAVSQSAISITSQSILLKRIALPRILLPLSTILSSLADLCVMFGLLVGLFWYYHFGFPPAFIWVFPLLAIHLFFLIGICCFISLANVFLRDIGHAVPSLLQLWFFASPVFYPTSMVPEEFRFLAAWNPMTGLIEGYRSALLLGKTPSWELLMPAIFVSVGVLTTGIFVFRRLEGNLADIL